MVTIQRISDKLDSRSNRRSLSAYVITVEDKSMAGSSFGTLFRVTTWGESHGKGLGVTVDGCPAGLSLCEEDIQAYLDRRKPGQNRYTTKRSESDSVKIWSGVFEGKTTGTPISLVIENGDQHSADYSNLKDVYRPGHADLGFDEKYGLRDYRGGGRSSGRETAARVAAGAIAAKILKELGVEVTAYTASIGPVVCDPSAFDEEHLKNSALYMPDAEAEENAREYLDECMAAKDSSGGTVHCVVKGLPAGIGEPVFDKLDALLSQALFSIGAVKGVEIGDGLFAAMSRGSENNDQYQDSEDGPKKASNHAGGILGGMSDGSSVLIRAAFKPTPSIAQMQTALGSDGQVHGLEITGRHDPVIVPRAVVVVECMTAITVLDLMMRNMTARMDSLKKIYAPA